MRLDNDTLLLALMIFTIIYSLYWHMSGGTGDER